MNTPAIFHHLMIDIETGGTNPGCAIFSIGACAFNPYTPGSIHSQFYIEISHSSNQELNLAFDPNTMDWWQEKAPNGPTHIKDALQQLLIWISNHPSTAHWANSPSFDYVILKTALGKLNKSWPLKYTQERDLRTLRALAFPSDPPHLNNSHNALQDAVRQALFVQLAYQRLNLTGDTPCY